MGALASNLPMPIEERAEGTRRSSDSTDEGVEATITVTVQQRQ
jgi:hypothetical protein